jgi:CheY-like chemotaxis protein
MKTILVVEDDRSLARLVQLNLEAEGYRVSVCSEGGGALDGLRCATPDLVLLDLRLPTAVSGWDVLTYLRTEERLRRVPVVVLSAYAQAQDRTQAKAAGASQYLVKPFGVADLLACVARWVGAADESQR